MNIEAETLELRKKLDELVLVPDDDLHSRYAMRRPSRPPGLYWQLRWLAGRILRALREAGFLAANPWPVSLKHSKSSNTAKPLVIWAIGADPRRLRDACEGIAAFLSSAPDIAAVLVTNVADFAYYSRLGWLVEYVPSIEGCGESFDGRKTRYLARLYGDAVIVPLHSELSIEFVRSQISNQA